MRNKDYTEHERAMGSDYGFWRTPCECCGDVHPVIEHEPDCEYVHGRLVVHAFDTEREADEMWSHFQWSGFDCDAPEQLKSGKTWIVQVRESGAECICGDNVMSTDGYTSVSVECIDYATN